MLNPKEQQNLVEKFKQAFDSTKNQWISADSYHEFQGEFLIRAVEIMKQIIDTDNFKQQPAIHKI